MFLLVVAVLCLVVIMVVLYGSGSFVGCGATACKILHHIFAQVDFRYHAFATLLFCFYMCCEALRFKNYALFASLMVCKKLAEFSDWVR